MRSKHPQATHLSGLSSTNRTKSLSRPGERGVVLIIALIILVIVSLLATFSIRNAVSTEAVSGNVRTTQLATQAAEAALRYCEDGVAQSFAPTPAFVISPIVPSSTAPKWKDLANWDTSTSLTAGTPTYVITVPSTVVGGSVTFQRAPECMVEHLAMVNASGAVSTTSTFIVTARGFGPEVAAVDSTRRAPTGSEAWMQSTISFK